MKEEISYSFSSPHIIFPMALKMYSLKQLNSINMKNLILSFILIIGISWISACSVVTGIFKAGMGFGIFLVIAVIGLILFFVFKARSK